jgi:hypothetical protein
VFKAPYLGSVEHAAFPLQGKLCPITTLSPSNRDAKAAMQTVKRAKRGGRSTEILPAVQNYLSKDCPKMKNSMFKAQKIIWPNFLPA